jgi:hypothetical protein
MIVVYRDSFVLWAKSSGAGRQERPLRPNQRALPVEVSRHPSQTAGTSPISCARALLTRPAFGSTSAACNSASTRTSTTR